MTKADVKADCGGADRNVRGTPFDNAFKTLIHDCPKLAVFLVNDTFGEHFTGDERVVLHDKEHIMVAEDGKTVTRVTDSSFTIVGYKTMNVHYECQSTDDRQMIVRFWEYDAKTALDGASIADDGSLVIEFPYSAVLYLRHTSRTPDALRVKIRTHSGRLLELDEIPVVKAQRYSIDEMFDKDLLILIPFYIFTHESRFAEYENDDAKLDLLLTEWSSIRQRLEEAVANGIIDEFTKTTIILMSREVLRGIAAKTKKVVKGVERVMGGVVLEHEAKTIRNQGRAEGREEGRAEGREEGRADGMLEQLFRLVSKGRLSFDDALAETALGRADFQRRFNEYTALSI